MVAKTNLVGHLLKGDEENRNTRECNTLSGTKPKKKVYLRSGKRLREKYFRIELHFC